MQESRAVNETDFKRVSDFVTNVFANDEPMSKALGLASHDIINAFGSIIHNCCSSGLSYLIEQDGTILSVSLALPYTIYEKCHINHIPVCQPLIAILDELGKSKPPIMAIETTAYHFMVGTLQSCSKKGLGKQVITKTMDSTRQNDYTCIVADATSSVSQYVLSSYFDYTFVCQVPYAEFEYNNSRWFESIVGTASAMRLVKYLSTG